MDAQFEHLCLPLSSCNHENVEKVHQGSTRIDEISNILKPTITVYANAL
jgi:2-C-methyl-D-erythritol 4-phosphate cytidylyltransferase